MLLEKILQWGDLTAWCVILLIVIIITYYTLFVTRNRNIPIPEEKRMNRFAVLIPARNESKVIEHILLSIEQQDYPLNMKDVYVIVESSGDPTVDIVKRHGGQIFIRTDLENRHRKGYALDECIKDILAQGKHYDGYFIFDADNTMEKDYFSKMNATFNQGYDLACGYRRPTNPDESTVATCSALIFSMINAFGNAERARKNFNVTITGTGFFIRGYLVEEWQGYPFHSLTEDYELTMYATWKGLSTTYNETAVYMDEQPTTMEISNKQRLRWVKGYFESRKSYSKKIRQADKETNQSLDKRLKSMGIVPFAIMVAILALYICFCLGLGIASMITGEKRAGYDAFLRVAFLLFAIYFCLSLLTGCMFYTERGKTQYRMKSKIKACLFNPVFLASFIPIALKVLFSKKEIQWDEIRHTGETKK